MTLGVTHRRALRGLARCVADLGTSRLLATCADPMLLQEAFAALREMPGVVDVVAIEVGEGERGPWACVEETLRVAGPRDHVVYAVHGLPRLAGRPDTGVDAYRELNLARDNVAATGVHLLVCLADVGEVAEFARRAPDWWSRRNELVTLLSDADFPAVPARRPAAPDRWDARIEAAGRRRAWAARGRDVLGEISALDEMVMLLWEQGRFDDAERTLAEIRRLNDENAALRSQHPALARILFGRAAEIASARGRDRDVRALAVSLLEDPSTPPGTRRRVLHHDAGAAAALGYRREALARNEEALRTPPDGGATSDADLWYERGRILQVGGFVHAARAALRRSEAASPDETLAAWISDVRGVLDAACGDAEAALGQLLAAERGFGAGGAHRYVAIIRKEIADRYWVLGHPEPALRWLRWSVDDLRYQQSPTGLGWRLSTLGDWLATVPRHHAEARATYEEAARVFQAALHQPRDASLRVDLAIGLASVYWLDLASLDSEAAPPLRTRGLTVLQEARGLVSDPELLGRLDWEEAKVLQAVGAHSDAVARAERARGWAAAFRGPSVQGEIEGLRAGIGLRAGDWAMARAAAEAMTALVEGESVYLLRDAWVARARALLGSGEPAGDAWAQARGVLQAQGLRVAEVEVLLDRLDPDIATVPRDVSLGLAREALELARDIAHPRTEARAWMVLAEVDSGAASERALTEAWEISAELGPPARVARLRRLAEARGVVLSEPDHAAHPSPPTLPPSADAPRGALR